MNDPPKIKTYPGEDVTPDEFFKLAEEYRRAAEALLEIRRSGEPLSRAPFHLVAIHATELYLNALLAFEGMKPDQLRALQHDLHARATHERAGAVVLKKGTIAHLAYLSTSREYLVSRYGVAEMRSVSNITRVQATLKEIHSKVAKRLSEKRLAAPAPRSVKPSAPLHSHSIVPGGLLVTS